MTLRLPVTAPEFCGINETDNLAPWCGPSVTGRLGPTKLKTLPEAAAFEIVTLTFPLFPTETGRIALLPTCTVPKLVLETLTICAKAAVEMERSKQGRRRRPRLRGDPGQLMSFALFLAVLTEHGWGIWSYGCGARRCLIRAAPVMSFFLKRDYSRKVTKALVQVVLTASSRDVRKPRDAKRGQSILLD